MIRLCERFINDPIVHGRCIVCGQPQTSIMEHYLTAEGRVLCPACMPAFVIAGEPA